MKRLQLKREVRGDWPFYHHVVAESRIYEGAEIKVNPRGAVSVLTPNGYLGLKPAEFDWLPDSSPEKPQ